MLLLYFFFRCLACTLFFCVPLLLIISSANDPAMGMLLLIPMIGLIPGYIMALILFVPVEVFTAKIGNAWLANFLVPAMGAVGAVMCFIALALYHGQLEIMLRNLASSPDGFTLWIGLGVVWGVLWRLTALVRLLPFLARRSFVSA